MRACFSCLIFLLLLLAGLCKACGQDILLSDFEETNYVWLPGGTWAMTGTAFGTDPAQGTLPTQQAVTGFYGQGLVNTFLGGDQPTGVLTSPQFAINRSNISFRIGGGYYPNTECIELLVNGSIVRSSTGKRFERLLWDSWDVSAYMGQTGQIKIVDQESGDWGHINIDQIVLGDNPKVTIYSNSAVTRAMSSLSEAAPTAQADPERPIYHVLPPAYWCNDPNGSIYYGGYYHLFYQSNPYGSLWADQYTHWGHARSADLVYWEQLPVALAPNWDLDENGCFDGTSAINGNGEQLFFFTSERGNLTPPAVPAIAYGQDANLIEWQPSYPSLCDRGHMLAPYIFDSQGQTYMATADTGDTFGLSNNIIVARYKASSPDLTYWTYDGVLFTHPDQVNGLCECPNLFPLNGKWVLMTSRPGDVEHRVGHLDAGNAFVTETIVDAAGQDYDVPNTMLDPLGRQLLFGWIPMYVSGRDWNGCYTVPRVLSIGGENRLRQLPAPELQSLRSGQVSVSNIALSSSYYVIPGLRGRALEIQAEFQPGTSGVYGLRVRRSDDGTRGIPISYDGVNLNVNGVAMPFSLPTGETTLKLDVLLDGSVLEVFANDGASYVSKVISPGVGDFGVEVFAGNGSATLLRLTGWTMGSIWGAPPVAPQLTIIPSGANIILTWPTNYAGSTLQSATNLGSPAVWSTNSSGPVIVIGGQNVVVNPISGPQMFFRLSK